jgi:S-formylglutathione hydrolase FrmB
MSRQIPGAGSGFHPRAAMIYLPPAVAKEPHLRLPLLVLLHGQPGAPSDWLDKGSAATVLDDFAATHHGQTPVVVMPDINGSDAGDTGCVHAPGGANVERYLNTVVPRWALEHLPITSARSEWAIAGLSEGGTCAAMLALRAYPGYRLFGDFSGLAHLTVGPRNNPPATIAQLFGGSRTAYDQHDPILLMQQNRYPRLAALFVCGAADHTVLADQNQMIAQARSAAITVRSAMHPGGHDWSIWHQALSQLLPWFWTLSQP